MMPQLPMLLLLILRQIFAAASASQGGSPICSHLRCNLTHKGAESAKAKLFLKKQEPHTIYFNFTQKNIK
jgi:hypothetical protein